MSLEGLDIRILGPAFAAGLLVLSTHVPLGREVLARGIIFIDLAVAQVAGLGVIVAYALDWTSRGWKVQAAAVGAALSAALLLNWTEKRCPGIQEALIGALFVLAASGAVLMLAGDPRGGEHLKELLAGQILWVTWQDLIPVMVVYVITSGLWFGLRRVVGRWFFYVVFGVTVTASVQLVGVYLVFASLILPALAVHQLGHCQSLGWGLGIGAAGYAAGLVFSGLADLPSGPAIVCALAAMSGLGGWTIGRATGEQIELSDHNAGFRRELQRDRTRD